MYELQSFAIPGCWSGTCLVAESFLEGSVVAPKPSPLVKSRGLHCAVTWYDLLNSIYIYI